MSAHDDLPTTPLRPEQAPAERPTRARIVRTVLFSLTLSLLLLFAVVLPAEYGRDPLGTGRLLGLDALAATAPETLTLDLDDGSAFHVTDSRPPRHEKVTLRLDANEEIEYKARLMDDMSMIYRWKTSGGQPLYVDLHGHPFNDLSGEEVRYEELLAASERNGAVRAPYAGMHGWYWRNDTGAPVDVELEAWGQFVEFEEMHRATFDPADLPSVEGVAEATTE